MPDTSEIKPCPCGKTPKSFNMESPPQSKWMMCSPSCCGEWSFEFRAQYETDAKALVEKAALAWNYLPRAAEPTMDCEKGGKHELVLHNSPNLRSSGIDQAVVCRKCSKRIL